MQLEIEMEIRVQV